MYIDWYVQILTNSSLLVIAVGQTVGSISIKTPAYEKKRKEKSLFKPSTFGFTTYTLLLPSEYGSNI